jgi:hypothetical protein
MLIVEAIARIRREHFFKSKTIKEIAREPEGVAEYGSERVEVGRDLLRIRAAGGCRDQSWTTGSRAWRIAGGDRN